MRALLDAAYKEVTHVEPGRILRLRRETRKSLRRMRKLEFTEQSPGDKTATLRSRAVQKVQFSIQQSTEPYMPVMNLHKIGGKTCQKE